jgi:glycerol uptake facilitator-like aquaporin
MLSDTFAGIAPASVPGFVVAQLLGAVVACGLIRVLWPAVEAVAQDVVVPHEPMAAQPPSVSHR